MVLRSSVVQLQLIGAEARHLMKEATCPLITKLAIALVGLLRLTGCVTSVPQPFSPLPSPNVTPPPSSSWVYTDTLRLPNGQVLPVECHVMSPNVNCFAIHPNGNRMSAEGIEWSPDKTFATVGVGATHDSPFGAYEIWNIVDGIMVGEISSGMWHQWVPDKPHTLAYVYGPRYQIPGWHLVYFDVGTEKETYLTTCPIWLQQSTGYDIRQACKNSFESPLPTPTH